jgi:DNA-binding response OmpR family regulator
MATVGTKGQASKMNRHVLVVEDDLVLARLLQDALVRNGYLVDHASTIEESYKKLEETEPSLVLLDLVLPDGDGLQICRTLAASHDRPWIIVVSARSSQADRIRGLDAGADDYLSKPFGFGELLARMRAVTRRARSTVDMVRLGKVTVDFRAGRASRAGRDLRLSYRELEVLRVLAEQQCRPVTRDDLLHAVWGYREVPLTRSVDICISRLRRKIENDPHRPQYLRTVHGNGCTLTLGTRVESARISELLRPSEPPRAPETARN